MSEKQVGSYQGTLKKKGSFFGIWNNCYCEVCNSEFIVYKNYESKIIEKRIPIGVDTTVAPLEDDKRKFKIDSPGINTFVFLSESEEVTMEWILAIKSQAINDRTTTMDDFNIISVLGRGYYGKVMLVQKKGTKNLYAIKSIHKARLIQTRKVHTVFSERNILMKVKHPFIVSLSFAFQSMSKFYLGMQYIPGGELFRYLSKVGKLQMSEVRFYAAEIGLALSHLHSNGIIYRDLKPENILLDEEGHIKLTDFGLAKDMSFDSATSTFCGTVEYLAPEIVRREPYGMAIDWWSYGCLVYEFIFGHTPFYDENRAKIFMRIPADQPYYPSDFDPNVSDFINQLLSKDPETRATFDTLKDHPFWEGMDFDEVLERKVEPLYVPPIDDKFNPENFDSAFTRETPCDSVATPAIEGHTEFNGFSFVGSMESQKSNSDAKLPPIPTFK
ncbi:AGC family protein kinase [Trichomonas vaginalis G3]|uniref:AGC family protein kinase n=1 Tax=Trichomonas vaginalis (strain ATCC PRA-98 / G3) TaxID=412133 RepID=A2DA20_TRIV3|nr:STKc AGC domain-containing protein [Trichomonas vaginalis G3]EAY22668.1 AGC family protein kinase [Trichomonas vaginalis G3]KAI5525482.1 STKc AGC domain-containing protein [Trichomonas vaginalis G3]|eukprot:XP_001583654.1 AGC family protein kinase [Trichomonas vaginalis G3]